MPYISTSTGTIALVNQYNYSQSLVKDIIGLGQDGWGQSSQNSSPVTNRSRQSRAHWLNITRDLDFIQQHILNSQTTGLVPATATTIVNTFPNAVGALVDSLAAQRYQCHPTQFYGYPGAVINTLNGTTSRTTPWGKELSQEVQVDWPTHLFARYFFNSGSVFTWRPNYTSIATPNDRDEEWAAFIDYIQAQPAYEYTRADFLSTSSSRTTSTYSSGTLSVTVIAERNGSSTSSTRVNFTALFRNNDLGYITVEPERGYWNYGPWEQTYSITPTSLSVSEGDNITFNISTIGITDGTTLYWTLSGTGITSADFSPSTLSGSTTINSNAASVTKTMVLDSTGEDSETFTFSLRTVSTLGSVVTSTNIVISNVPTITGVPTTIASGPSNIFNPIVTGGPPNGTVIIEDLTTGYVSDPFLLNSNGDNTTIGAYLTTPTGAHTIKVTFSDGYTRNYTITVT